MNDPMCLVLQCFIVSYYSLCLVLSVCIYFYIYIVSCECVVDIYIFKAHLGRGIENKARL